MNWFRCRGPLFFVLVLTVCPRFGLAGNPPQERTFYVAADPAYTIADSVLDSLRFTMNKTLVLDGKGHLVSISSFVNPEGEVMGWHDFGNLEGPGWAANAVGGAWEIYRCGALLGPAGLAGPTRSAILDHVLDCGFIDEATGFIRGYRETTTGKFCLNYKHNSDWFCPGSMAKIAFQLLLFADELGERPAGATGCGRWPSRMRRLDRPERRARAQRLVPAPHHSGRQGLPQIARRRQRSLLADLGRRAVHPATAGGADRSASWPITARSLREKTARLHGGRRHLRQHQSRHLRSARERRLLRRVPHPAAGLAGARRTRRIREFAYEKCLAGLDQFKMREDRNGVATKGLLYMEKSWDTAYLWENAEAALAYFEAAADTATHEPGPEPAAANWTAWSSSAPSPSITTARTAS